MQSVIFSTFLALRHVFTTRSGGVSTVPYASNNFAFHVGDHEEDVRKNHANLAQQFRIDHKQFVHMQQIHSDKILVINSPSTFKSPPQCDALITDQTGIALMVMTADCTPVLLYDPVRHVCAAIHAGRAGALKGIVPQTVQKMQQHFNCRASNIVAVLGPSIHECCYEIGGNVAREVSDKGYAYALTQRQKQYYLNVNKILRRQLIHARVAPSHIEELEQCTACDTKQFFSYRAQQQTTGRSAAVIMLLALPS